MAKVSKSLLDLGLERELRGNSMIKGDAIVSLHTSDFSRPTTLILSQFDHRNCYIRFTNNYTAKLLISCVEHGALVAGRARVR